MIVLDASPLIAYFDAADALHDRAVARLRRLGGERFAISPLTLAEVLVGPTRNGALDVIRTGLEILQVEEIGLPDDAAVRLASLRDTTRLKLPDCCVVLAAQQSAAAVLTFDNRLAAASERLGVPLVAIDSPPPSPRSPIGALRGRIWIADDFDELGPEWDPYV